MRRPNVLLIVLDSVRARNLASYGYAGDTGDFLRRFADSRATTFTQARSPSTWTIPSHASMFTGLSVAEHGIESREDRLKPGHSVWEHLGDEHGYRTGVFSSTSWLTETPIGLKDLFDSVHRRAPPPFPAGVDLRDVDRDIATIARASLESGAPVRSVLNGVAAAITNRHPGRVPERFHYRLGTYADAYANLFLDWTAETDGPWAACINFLDAHHEYSLSPPFDSLSGSVIDDINRNLDYHSWSFTSGDRPWWQLAALQGVYDDSIRFVDHQIERIVRTLSERGDLEDTLLVVTADHGDGFGEQSRVRPRLRVAGHLYGTHEVLLHIPLFVKAPGQDESATVDDLATLTNVPAAVRAALAGESITDAFTTDRAIASSHGLRDPYVLETADEQTDVDRYTGLPRAVYEPTDDGAVRKYATWDEDAVTVRIEDADTSFAVSTEGRERVEAAFDSLTDAGVRSDAGDVSEAVRDRLDRLGYV